MKEEEHLLNLNLQKQNEKQSLTQPEGMKLYLFRSLYSLLQIKSLNHFCDFLFVIFEFIQLMAFPMDTVFSSGWKNYWYETIGSFFKYFHLISLWSGNTQFYLITYIITFLYILILIGTFIHILVESTSLTYKTYYSNKLLSLLLEFEIILNIPIFKTLFAAFTCENEVLQAAPYIKCKSGIHIFLIIFSTILSLIFLFLIILFRSTLYEFGSYKEKLKAAYTSSTELLLELAKTILIILYQFIKNEMALAILTFFISLILYVHFLKKKPFYNGLTMKLYCILYLLFFWSSIICLLSILLKNSKFEGGILLLIIGYPLIIISISTQELDYSFDKIFEFLETKENDGYKALLDIEYFLKLENSLEDKIRTQEQKVLYSYISNYENNCTLINCPLKQFMKIPLKVENFMEMKIYLLQHGEMLFKNAISKFPFNAKLRLSYGLFLFNKLNKKLKGINEISLLNKFNTNLEDSFLIYKAQRYIEEENGYSSNLKYNSKNSKSNNYKFTLNNIKSLIGKISMNYIDFWTILAVNGENKSENFQKMSKIGTRISKLNGELMENLDKLEALNSYEPEIFKLYIQYLEEILGDSTQANIYSNKLSENEQKKHQYNEENLFELNYKEMSRNEDYKYIVLRYSQLNFDTICNLSLSICPLFGYSKEELVGHPYNCLVPELLSLYHRQMLKDKIDEFKKQLLRKNVKSRSESWFDDYSFGINKLKYLIPIKVRWTIVSSEDEGIYSIGKIIQENQTPLELEQDIIYILTDKDLIIKNFTTNAPKLLYLHSSAINSNLDITEFIKEFNENYISNINLEDIKEASNISVASNKKKIRYIKSEIIKNMFLGNDSKRVIHWKLGDIISNDNNKGNKKNGIKKRISFARISEQKFQSAYVDTGKNQNIKNKIPKRKNSMSGVGVMTQIESESSIANRKFNASNTEDKLPNYESEKLNDLKDTNISDLNSEISAVIDKTYKDKAYFYHPIHHRFYLSVKEVKFKEYKIGYIFKFEPYNSYKNIDDANIGKSNLNNQLNSKYDLSTIKQEYNDIDKSEISVISFAAKNKTIEHRNSLISSENPFGISCENNDIFLMSLNKEKENEFTLDINKMSYKQTNLNEKYEPNNLYEILRQEAVEKISKATKQIKKEEISEEEEESSSGSYSIANESSENDSEYSSGRKNEEQSSHHSIKDVISQEKITSQKSVNNLNTEKKINSNKISNAPAPASIKSNDVNLNKINLISDDSNYKIKEDYYHVDTNKITYYVYNFTNGFVEVLKEQKYKISQVVKQINAEKDKLSKMNSKYITNQKLSKEKKKGNNNKKLINENEELNSYSEQMMKLKEIQKALTSKEKQSSIINLCIISFVIFFLIIGSGIMSIVINYYLKSKTFLFYNLIKKSIELYKNILMEITFVREMLIIDSPYYDNFYDPDKSHYYTNYTTRCYTYYLDTAFIISNISTFVNTLDDKLKNLIKNNNIKCYILEAFGKNDTTYSIKEYELSVFSAFRELNSALYHISQIKVEDIHTFEDNVYFFIKNGMSNLLIYSENQIQLLKDEFYNIVKNENKIILICLAALLIAYLSFYFIFNYFNQKVEERKQSYLSVFYEIGGEFIILSLAKCEKFSQKLQLQENINGGHKEKTSLDSSSIEGSDLDNEIQASSIIKQNKENKINISKKEKATKNITLLKTRIIGFIILFILLLCQYSTYIYYYLRLSLYKNCVQYEYYLTKYMSSFLFPFIGIREYIYERNKYFYNIPVREYIDDTLHKFYLDLSTATKNKDKYVNYFPESYKKFLEYLYSERVFELINQFITTYPGNGLSGTDDFFYGVSKYGFLSILTTYIEEIRMLKDTVDDYIVKSEEKNFIYNESYFNGPNNLYENIYDMFKNNSDDYRKLNPANALHSSSHKTLIIIYRFVIAQVIKNALSEMFLTFEEIFDSTIRVGLIINIVFIIVVVLGFFLIWVPFVIQENETIFKTKNMLSIIPKEILITLPHINIMLGLDEEKN